MRLMRALAPADGFLKSLRMHEKKDVPQRLRRFRAYSFYGTTEAVPFVKRESCAEPGMEL